MPRVRDTPLEYSNIHFIYGDSRSNASLKKKLQLWYGWCEEAGRLQLRQHYEEDIFNDIEEDPSISSRALSRQIQMPKSTIHNILKANRYHPHHFLHVQTVLPGTIHQE
ncbi:hypothetical protein ABEB36_005398 [Hypothenemus hampei]|uniref:HTH psq-type domain-containing protein n=1 Tax=Hypothenemus hampei TaxID=57062 RepID=A0ABD1F0Q5_HYPHA